MPHPQDIPRRARLTNKLVRGLPPARGGQYVVRDERLPGFHVVVGRRARTYTIQVDTHRLGQRKTVKEAIGRAGEWDADDARKEARARIGGLQTGARETTARRVTLGMAWAGYREELEHKVAAGNRSPRTLKGYRDSVERVMADWLDTPLRDLSENTRGVAERHREISERHGGVTANHAMKVLRAIYNHARKTRMERGLPAEGPTDAVRFNNETRRDTGMDSAELAAWHRQLRALPNPIRQEFHFFCLLSGGRPDATRRARWEHLDVARRTLRFPDPKGGARKAFDMPLSRAMLRCLHRARRAGRVIHGRQAETYIFPADTPTGCMTDTREPRDRLAKWGGDLRQTYRTAAAIVGLGEMDAHLLMNHSMGGVSAGYITRGAMLDHLIAQQERVSGWLVAALGNIKN